MPRTRNLKSGRTRGVYHVGRGESATLDPIRPYTYTDNRPGPGTVYMLDGVAHTFDGKCHETCENLR